MVFIVFNVRVVWLVGGPGIELIPQPGRPSMFMSGQESMYVIHSQLPLSAGRGSVRLAWRDSRKSTYKGEVKLR